MRNQKHVYAVIRIDEYFEDTDMEKRITVKEIVETIDEADEEVKRLMKLNAEKGCKYFWQTTRMKLRRIEEDKMPEF
jgi:hypothetical protein